MIVSCRLCKSNKLVEVLSFGDVFLSDFVAANEVASPKRYPLDVIACVNCFLVQLRATPPADELYTDRYGYRSGINVTMRRELEEIVRAVEGLVKLSKGDMVLDIGSNDGTLLKQYGRNDLQRVGFDPVAKFQSYYSADNEVFVNAYFSYQEFQKRFGKKKAKVITAISMFYDLDDPNSFVEDVKQCLDKEGVFVIQQNYLVAMLEQTAFDNIVHEHLEYYSLLSLESLLERHGLEVFDVLETRINGGSFRTYIQHKGGMHKIEDSVYATRVRESKLHFGELSIYKDFAKRVEQNCRKLYRFIKNEVKKGKRVYLYGASTRGNTLLQVVGLTGELITAAVERNPEKWGRKIASVKIPIISEEQARSEKPDYLLVLPWFFKEEFIEREKQYLVSGGKFIFPLPEMYVYGMGDNKP